MEKGMRFKQKKRLKSHIDVKTELRSKHENIFSGKNLHDNE